MDFRRLCEVSISFVKTQTIVSNHANKLAKVLEEQFWVTFSTTAHLVHDLNPCILVFPPLLLLMCFWVETFVPTASSWTYFTRTYSEICCSTFWCDWVLRFLVVIFTIFGAQQSVLSHRKDKSVWTVWSVKRCLALECYVDDVSAGGALFSLFSNGGYHCLC